MQDTKADKNTVSDTEKRLNRKLTDVEKNFMKEIDQCAPHTLASSGAAGFRALAIRDSH